MFIKALGCPTNGSHLATSAGDNLGLNYTGSGRGGLLQEAAGGGGASWLMIQWGRRRPRPHTIYRVSIRLFTIMYK